MPHRALLVMLMLLMLLMLLRWRGEQRRAEARISAASEELAVAFRCGRNGTSTREKWMAGGRNDPVRDWLAS
jgi:hypothetical protein